MIQGHDVQLIFKFNRMANFHFDFNQMKLYHTLSGYFQFMLLKNLHNLATIELLSRYYTGC